MKSQLLSLLLALCAAGSLCAATFNVTNTHDSGPGSFRQALLDANANAGADRITFSIPGDGPHIITSASELPLITGTVVIDGYTQGDSTPSLTSDDALENTNPVGGLNTVLKIQLVGHSVLFFNEGSAGSVLRGLAIGASGIEINTSNIAVEGCFIGTDTTGTIVRANGSGIQVNAGTGNRIGGSRADQRNLISGNSYAGVVIELTIFNISNVEVSGNLIGTDVTGTKSLANGLYGIAIEQGSNSGTGGGPPLPYGSLTDVYVGLPGSGRGNIISGNAGYGIIVLNDGAVMTGITIRNNRIGTNAAGTTALPNGSGPGGGSGVGVLLSAPYAVQIGGAGPGEGNLISGNITNGVLLSGTANSAIQGNYIGTDITGAAPIGNGNAGIVLVGSADLIGGTSAGSRNVIAYNARAGVSVEGSEPGGSFIGTIIGNSIYSNGALGIDLNADGVTPNDSGDTDGGANFSQNYPVLSASAFNDGNVRIQGTLNSNTNTGFRVEFFGNAEIDASGFGEGRQFLGATNVQTDGSGNAAFDVTLPFITGSQKITATATGPAGTSEYSAPNSVIGAPAQLLNIATRMRVQSGENVLIAGFIITGKDPKKVIIRGMGPSLGQFFSGTLENPTLELFEENTLLASNDDWKENQGAVEATGIPPGKDLESAIVRVLQPGSYTAILRGKDNKSGIGVVEAYDLDQGANSELANIATRGFVETGNNVMIAGVTTGPAGGGSTRVVVRALGPSLSAFQIAGALPDPSLELVNSSGAVIRSNNDWKNGQANEVTALGLQPSDDRESALIETLAPGQYTAIVRGLGNTPTGVAVVDVYHVQ